MTRKELDYGKRGKINRVVSILNLIGDGVDGEELIRRVEESEVRLNKSEKKGTDSEARVAEFLDSMKEYGLIVGYKKEERGGARDLSGIDFKVEISDLAGIPGFGHVWVQAKSSEMGRRRFIANGGGERVVTGKRIVVVNGQLDKNDLFTQFWGGVVEIARSKGWQVKD